MAEESAQNSVWNSYIEKHNTEPSTAQQLLNFARNKSNLVACFTYLTARQVFARNKGKGKRESHVSITPTQIDSILDEIEQNEQNEHQLHIQQVDDHTAFDWSNILKGNISKNIRSQIGSRDIDINGQNPNNGMTLLHYAVIIGSLALVKTICNFGANVHIKDHDGHDALKYAMQYGRYKITELIYYRQLRGAVGTDMKDIATRIHRKNKEAQFMRDNGFKSIEFMIKAVEQRAPFGADMLFYAWYFVLNRPSRSRYFEKPDPLQSKLFKTMMKTYEDILRNTDDTEGWKWLKDSLINSLIWYLPHPVHAKKATEDAADVSVDSVLRKTMFYELLVRVHKESKRQSDLLLKQKIDKIKEQRLSEWQQLISYGINTQYSKIARQDLCGCLVPRYTESELSEDIYPPSTHFSAKKHYDTNIYLNELMFRGNIMDHLFQKAVKQITIEINAETGDSVHYTAGPVKTLARSQTKVENNYINEDYPTSAKILDINRCALHFNNIKSMMRFITRFASKIKAKEAYCLVDIIRCKNGWNVYDEAVPQYTDIKLNVLVLTDKTQQIIAEIQFLLDLMSDFKKKSHKLYSIERKQELVYNFGQLTLEMKQFDDILNLNDIFIKLIDLDDLKFFKRLFALYPNVDALINDPLDQKCRNTALFHILKRDKSTIYHYFTTECIDLYRQTMLNYVTKYLNKYGYEIFFHQITFDEDAQLTLPSILVKMLELFRQPMDLRKFLFAQNVRKSFLSALNCREYSNAFALVFNTALIDEKWKYELLFDAHNGFKDPFRDEFADNMATIIRYIQNDRHLLMRGLNTRYDWKFGNMHTMMMGICKSFDPMSTDALRLILNNPLLSEQEKYDLFTQREEGDANCTDSTTNMAFKSGLGDNALRILDYFYATNRKGLIELLAMQREDGEDTPLMDTQEMVFMRVFYYFRDSRDDLLRLLSVTNKKGRTVFGCMMKWANYKYCIRCIICCNALTEEDKLQLLSAVDNDGLSSLMYGSDVCIVEVLRYVKDDRELTLKLLSFRGKDEGKTPLMFIHNDKRKTLQFILQHEALSEADKFKLCTDTDEEGKSVLYHAFKCAKDSYFDENNKALHILIIEHFMKMNESEYLSPLLLQQTKDGETCAMVACDKPLVINILLMILRKIKDNKIMSQFLNCKNKKDETLLTVAIRLTTNPNNAFHTKNITKWLDYLQFDEALNDKEQSVETVFAFLDEKKQENAATNENRIQLDIPAVPKCVCGLGMNNATFGFGRGSGSGICGRCGQTPRQSKYSCQSNRTFVMNGRVSRHTTPFIVCQKCFNIEIQQRQAAFAKAVQEEALLAVKNKNHELEFETNPFITACEFGKAETIKKAINRITDKQLLLKLLSCKDSKDKRNTAIHALCKTDCVQSLRLLFLNNDMLSTHDKFEVMRELNFTPLTDANGACGIEVIQYFNKTDRKILLQLATAEMAWFADDSVRLEVLKCFEHNAEILKQFVTKKQQQFMTANAHSSLRFILHNTALDDRFKVSLFDGVHTIQRDESHPRILFEILNYFRNDEQVLMRFLSPVGRETPLIGLCKKTKDVEWSVKVIKLILENDVLTKQDKMKILLAEEIDTHNSFSRNALNYACQNTECPQIAMQILNYFDDDEEGLTQLVLGSHKLLFDANHNNYQILQRILRVINGLKDDDLRWRLLSHLSDTGYTFIFEGNCDLRRTLFSCINDAQMISKLLECKNKKFQTPKDYQKVSFMHDGCSRQLKQNVQSIQEFEDYVRFIHSDLSQQTIADIRFTKYATNPFITSCYLGKEDVIKTLLSKLDAEKTKILLSNNCDAHNHNCLMILAQYRYYHILLFILNNQKDEELKLNLLRTQSMMDGQHLLLMLCANDRSDIATTILKQITDNDAKLSLIHLKDFYNQSCVDYVDANVLLK